MSGFRRVSGLQFIAALLLTFAFGLALASPLAAQEKDKKKKKNPPVVDNNSANPIVPLSDEQQIDYMISEVLGAWQIGDSERMHKYYSEEVTVVNGAWAPPVIGWTNYLVLYQQQRTHMKQVRLDRTNTYVKVNGTTAWACYQWEFASTFDGVPTAARGQTTLVLIKKENRWLIAHDHTSVVQTSKPGDPTGMPGGPAAQQDKPPA
jgi:ketosteroid isomerase-like protein